MDSQNADDNRNCDTDSSTHAKACFEKSSDWPVCGEENEERLLSEYRSLETDGAQLFCKPEGNEKHYMR